MLLHVGDLVKMIAVEMKECTADGTFQMKMLMTVTGFGFRTGILPAGAAAVIERIAPDESFGFELFKLTVDSCRADLNAAGIERDEELGSSDMLSAVGFEVPEHLCLLFGLISASARHIAHLQNENDNLSQFDTIIPRLC